MRYISGLGFDSRWRPNNCNSVLFKKPVKERGYWRVRLVAITTRLMKYQGC